MYRRSLAGVIFAAASVLIPFHTDAQDTDTAKAPSKDSAKEWQSGVALIGKPKYPDGFSHFDYVNVDAPKGGSVDLSETGSFDTLNPLLAKGELATGLNRVFESLLTPSQDEVFAEYGLLAESLRHPDDFSSVTFRLRKNARFSDGKPVTPEDVVWSFKKAIKLNPRQQFYYKHVKSAEKTGPREVTFRFDEKNNRELPQIVGQLLILPKHRWEAKSANDGGSSIDKTTLEPVIGSGPYTIASVDAGSRIVFKRNPDYWGKDLNVNVGTNNFDTITYTYFSDRNVEFQAFKSGNVDYWEENVARRWATGYDFPAVEQGRVKREKTPNPNRSSGVMVGFIPNLRLDKFADPRVRRALNYCFDFEELQRTIFYGQYSRIDSYFFGTELASKGLPKGEEKEILKSLGDKVPESVFTEPYTNPVAGSPEKLRANLRKAVELFKQAGYEIRDTGMVNTETGKRFSFEILLNGPTIEPVALAFAQNLKRIGIEARVRSIDPSSYINRLRGRDFDMIYSGWGQSLSPGNEQAEYWGSEAAEREGSSNYAGISDPGIDALIRKVIFAKDRDDLVAATHALDRDLLAHSYVVPTYAASNTRFAYWDKLARPEKLPKYAIGFPTIWWAKSAGQ